MEEDCLPLYEVVDNEVEDNLNKGTKSEYEKLTAMNTDSIQEEYQLPHSDSRYIHYSEHSEVTTETKSIKRTLRRSQVLFTVGGVITLMLLVAVVCIFIATEVRFGRNLAHLQKGLTEQIDALNEAYRTRDSHGSFHNCSEETASCDLISEPSYTRSWLYCNTPNLYMHKKVSTEQFYNNSMNDVYILVLCQNLKMISNAI